MSASSTRHDIVGIGMGPFNLGLAALSEPLDLDVRILEARAGFDWHPGLMFSDATLQVPFLADLVSLADPTSPYSFLNYLASTGRLYPFYIREDFLPLRREYNAYCQWAAERLRAPAYEQEATGVKALDDGYEVRTATGETYRARHLVVGTGTVPQAPAGLREVVGVHDRAVHAADYLQTRERVCGSGTGTVTVLGAGQSAAEVVVDLLENDRCDHIVWMTRTPRFAEMEYTKLTLELTSPEWSAHFRSLPEERRDALRPGQHTLYKGISGVTINRIHEAIYARSVAGEDPRITLLTGFAVDRADAAGDAGEITLTGRHVESGEAFAVPTDALVASTGYAQHSHPFLAGVDHLIRRDSRGRYAVGADYRIDDGTGPGGIFVQNAEEHTHGFVAPDLGMGAYRNSIILAEITGTEPYPIPQRIAFAEFGVPERFRVADPEPAPATAPATGPGFETRPVDPAADTALLHEWITHPRARFWGMPEASPAEIHAEYARIDADPHHHARIGCVDGAPAYLMETYAPEHSPLPEAGASVQPGDLGMHVLVAPPAGAAVPGHTHAVMRAVLDECFADPAVRRVVVEPDVGNDKIRVLNRRVGMRELGEIDLPDKTAMFSAVTREEYAATEETR